MRVSDIRNKIIFTLLMLIVFRIGAFIPVPYVNAEALQAQSQMGVFDLLNTFGGGALYQFFLHPNDFDFVVIRENSEGEYSEVGGRIHRGDDEIAIQNAVFTRKATERVMRFAFELAKKRRSHVTSATKSNGIYHAMPFWDEVFQQTAADYSGIETSSQHIDALAAFFVTRPETFDVIVASNLFGDILTDISSSLMGSIGIAPSANINPSGKYPSMFEPVHGSAPDIAGQGLANPIGQIWTAKLMLDHFGEEELGAKILDVMEQVTADGIKTRDIGGQSTTAEVTDEICSRLRKL